MEREHFKRQGPTFEEPPALVNTPADKTKFFSRTRRDTAVYQRFTALRERSADRPQQLVCTLVEAQEYLDAAIARSAAGGTQCPFNWQPLRIFGTPLVDTLARPFQHCSFSDRVRLPS